MLQGAPEGAFAATIPVGASASEAFSALQRAMQLLLIKPARRSSEDPAEQRKTAP